MMKRREEEKKESEREWDERKNVHKPNAQTHTYTLIVPNGRCNPRILLNWREYNDKTFINIIGFLLLHFFCLSLSLSGALSSFFLSLFLSFLSCVRAYVCVSLLLSIFLFLLLTLLFNRSLSFTLSLPFISSAFTKLYTSLHSTQNQWHKINFEPRARTRTTHAFGCILVKWTKHKISNDFTM